jgi:predicted GIY-YIG superfamily endonuclease
MTIGERAALANLPTALYRFYDNSGQLLYVGITHALERRWQAHKQNQLWWLDVARKEHVWLPNRAEAEAAELKAIQTEKPVWDKSRTPTRGETWCDNPRRDPREERLVSEAAQKIGTGIQSGAFPAWSFLPTPKVLGQRLNVSIRAAVLGRRRLSIGDGAILASSWHHYLVVPKAEFPAADVRRYGELYVIARHHFASGAFTVDQLAERSRMGSVGRKLADMEKSGWAVRVEDRPSRFRLVSAA